MEYKIIATGSKGNALLIENQILIDCGVPFKSLRPYANELKLVMVTHIHADHFNRTTISKLATERPLLRWAAPPWLAAPLVECGVSKSKIDVVGDGEGICYGNGITICMYQTTHNVPNCAWYAEVNGNRLFYATDTNSLSGIEQRNLDYYFIEANYSEEEIKQRIFEKQEFGQYIHEWDVLNNHLSKEKADDWLYQNMGPNSQYVYMHGHSQKG